MCPGRKGRFGGTFFELERTGKRRHCFKCFTLLS